VLYLYVWQLRMYIEKEKLYAIYLAAATQHLTTALP
jgi:hypothetical protein